MTLPLPSDITTTGLDQNSLVNYLTNVRDVVNELQDDHATYKTAADNVETLIEELHDDHATFKAVVDDAKTLLNNLRTFALNHRNGGLEPTFAIDTNFDVKNTEVTTYIANGVHVVLADNTNCDTGTAKTIAADKWAGMLICGSSAAALSGTWTADCDSEALAITAVKALSEANKCPLGYVTVQTASGQPWIAGTSALQSGTGGNVATTTNYYNYDNLVAISAAVSTAAPATLTAAKPASAPSTLTNATDLTLARG